MGTRLAALDWIRALAILVIIFHHLPGYTFNYYDLNNFGIPLDLSPLNTFNRYIGLSLFIFTSGYLLNLKKRQNYGSTEIKKFAFKRWIRIYPLYILAFSAFIVLYDVFNPAAIIVHLLGLQLFVASPDFKPVPTLWFVGLIVAYYSIFLVWQAKRLSQAIKLVIIVGFPFLIAGLNIFWQVTDFRLLLYYAVFWFGIYCGTSRILDRLPKAAPIALFLLLILIAGGMSLTDYAMIDNPSASFINFLITDIWMLCFIAFSYSVLRYFPSQGLTFHAANTIAYSSYCLYLFHRPFLSLARKVVGVIIPSDYQLLFSGVLVAITLPILFAVCLKIQQIYDHYIAPYLANYLLQPLQSASSK